MAIVFRLPSSGRVPVHVTPVAAMELVLSLHVLNHANAHPLQHPWIRSMRALSPELKREIRALRWLYDDWAPDCFLPERADGSPSFEDSLAAFRSLSPERVEYELARPLFHYAEADAPGRLTDEIRVAARGRAARYGPEAAALAASLLDDPAGFQARLADLLEAYWAESFAAEWERLVPGLAREAELARTEAEEDGLWALLERQRPMLRVDRAAGTMLRRSPHAHEVTLGDDAPLLLIPSAYVWPHVRVNCDGPWPLCLVVPPRDLARQAARRPAPEGVASAFRALGDETRLHVLALLADQPRTSEELAPLVGLSTSGLGRHLRALGDAGLVTTRRDGWYVLYSLDRERLDSLPASLAEYLGG